MRHKQCGMIMTRDILYNLLSMFRHKEQKCRYSGVDDIGSDSRNYCQFAHSSDELDEWKERYQWRVMKKKKAKEQNLLSYIDLLIDDVESANDTSSVVCL